MDLVTLRFPSAADFLSACEAPRTICYPTRALHRRGEPVVVDLRFPGLPVSSLLRARVMDTQPGRELRLQLTSREGATWEYLQAVARGEHAPAARIEPRYPAEVPVVVVDVAGSRTFAATRNLSARGCLVMCRSIPRVGETVGLRLGPFPSGGHFASQARVARVCDGDVGGFGARFIGHAGTALRMHLRRASESGRLALTH